MRTWRRRKRILWLRRAGLLTCAAVLVGGLIGGGLSLLFSGEESPSPVGIQPSTTTPAVTTQAPEQVTLTVDENVAEMGDFVDAQYAVLVDVTEGRIVAQKQPHVRAYPASITKILTLLVAVERTEELEATYEMSYHFINPLVEDGASRAGFVSGEKVTVRDMLYGCILPSGADATVGLANHLTGYDVSAPENLGNPFGAESVFSEWMNDRVTALGLENTHFTNTSGLHDKQHYTTAADMAVILAEAMKNPTCRQVLSAYSHTTSPTEQNPQGLELYSTMFKRMTGEEPEGATVVGGKTGYTAQAMQTMASYAVGADGHDYVVVTLYGSSNWKTTYDHINILSRYVGGKTEDFYE